MGNLPDHEHINWRAFEVFLRKLPYVPKGKLEVRKFTEGYSNQTYLIKIGEWEAIMRRPPFGEIPPKAHDMKREYNILSKISKVYPLAPEPYIYAEDAAIMNRHFYIMEKKQGIVIDESLPKEFDAYHLGPILTENVIKALVKLQSINCERENLMDIGKPQGFMERQVHGWIKRFNNAKTDNVTSIIELEKWLIDNIPKPTETTIVHNDFKINNLIFDAHKITNVNGVIDWELATIGDPLSDVGSSVAYWKETSDPDMGVTSVTDQPGFPNRREFVSKYAELSGRDVSNINYYVAFGFYKLAGILQQIYFRWSKGELEDERFRRLHQSVTNLMEMAEETRNNRVL